MGKPQRGSYADKKMKIGFTLLSIFTLSAMFTVGEGVSELLKNRKTLVCHELDLFTHGGMVFLFTTSIIFATVYFLIYLMYLLGLSKRWDFPSKKSFYRYAMVLSLINILQAIGSMLWYTGRNRRASGSAGICITSLTNFVYLTTFAPVVYWIFLKNYFRMNKLPPTERPGETTPAINTSEEPSPTTKKRSTSVRFSKPYLISKRSSYFEEQTMLEGDLESSVSSYGSFRDEETFSRLDK
ncbi:Transmembrane protein adipocyte-associated 1 homolog [Geodia barretti]|uniref:Transmembrane protein adipocyte-associated 1 homolog n=1 Tax=Geodia barretti TaxID=519541 RepID=A0AA35WWV3_GEOBA|nr:Transmembrane protein adipocyte-associated 1 homolog [Geodia barretti]